MIFETRSRDTEMEGTMIKRIGLLTSGGDCQALNATMRGVVKGLTNSIDDLEVYGFDDGYKGLIYGKYRMLTSKDFSGIRIISAPPAIPACRVRLPTLCPITSTINTRPWDAAVV